MKPVIYEGVKITDIGSEGKSLAKINELIVFTTQAIPGDVVDMQVIRKKKRYQEARILRFREFSPDRISPFCEHFGVCGGCKWQFMPYEKQLYYKEKQVNDQLLRIGRLKLPAVNPILGSPAEIFYRNKLEYAFSDSRWLTHNEISAGKPIEFRNALGFHLPGLFDKVIHIRKCWLQPDPSNEIREFVFQYASRNNLEFFNLKEGKGFLRNLIIRTSLSDEVMVIVVFYKEIRQIMMQFLESLRNRFPEITSLYYVINGKANDSLYDQEFILFSGKGFIVEEMEGLKFKISPQSFFQTNSEQALRLYKIVRDYSDLSGKEIVYDLYTGTGTIANFLAMGAKKVVGIDSVRQAITDARENSRFNNILNTTFYSGDIKDVLIPELIEKNGSPDVIVADPPRAGMHDKIVRAILSALPDKIVYVSCNPGTQARDLALLSSSYRITKIQPVDMFPQTQHVENVVLLNRIMET